MTANPLKMRIRARALLSPSKWINWTRELRGFLAARQYRAGFVAARSGQGVVYNPLPERVWPTTSFEFWVFLMALLQRVRPECIVELGSGRSTVFLSEYASKYHKPFVSVDQSGAWSTLSNTLARFGNITEQYVHHVPLSDDGFYQEEGLREILPPSPDFLFLDGPNGARDATRQTELYRRLAESARVVVLDDLQIPTIYSQVELFRRTGRRRDALFFRYAIKAHYDNYLAVLFDSDLRPAVNEVVNCLRVEAIETVSERICVDKKTGAPVATFLASQQKEAS